MIALGGPKLKLSDRGFYFGKGGVSMIALGGPKLKPMKKINAAETEFVSMIALGGPKLKLLLASWSNTQYNGFNDSTGWA